MYLESSRKVFLFLKKFGGGGILKIGKEVRREEGREGERLSQLEAWVEF